jgi:hypothetical protein
MKTNRDLYKGIESLIHQNRDQPALSLEAYLSNLLRRMGPMAHKEALSLDEFFQLLQDSFDDSRGVSEEIATETIPPAFQELKEALVRQIQDLHAMAENKQLEDPHRYFGITAPSGQYWYNFDPYAYLECGAAGSIGGWEEGDDTGRMYVPGQVVYLDTDGKLNSCDPQDLDRPPIEMPVITWEMFADFVWCGQNYE